MGLLSTKKSLVVSENQVIHIVFVIFGLLAKLPISSMKPEFTDTLYVVHARSTHGKPMVASVRVNKKTVTMVLWLCLL